MFPFPIATPQGCNIQTFYGFGTNVGNSSQRTWSKPVGVSHVYIMLIGSGGNGISTQGGGSGAVTVWYGAAQHVPDILYVVATGQGTQGSTQIYFDPGQVYLLLDANSASTISGGVVTPSNEFAVSGFYSSTAGQSGSTTSLTPSATTFLSGGSDSTSETVTANYGYFVAGNGSGFFQMQPIIVGAGGSATGRGGIGCGGGADSVGGPGFALIASW